MFNAFSILIAKAAVMLRLPEIISLKTVGDIQFLQPIPIPGEKLVQALFRLRFSNVFYLDKSKKEPPPLRSGIILCCTNCKSGINLKSFTLHVANGIS